MRYSTIYDLIVLILLSQKIQLFTSLNFLSSTTAKRASSSLSIPIVTNFKTLLYHHQSLQTVDNDFNKFFAEKKELVRKNFPDVPDDLIQQCLSYWIQTANRI